jgi:hypothetical protein
MVRGHGVMECWSEGVMGSRNNGLRRTALAGVNVGYGRQAANRSCVEGIESNISELLRMVFGRMADPLKV